MHHGPSSSGRRSHVHAILQSSIREDSHREQLEGVQGRYRVLIARRRHQLRRSHGAAQPICLTPARAHTNTHTHTRTYERTHTHTPASPSMLVRCFPLSHRRRPYQCLYGALFPFPLRIMITRNLASTNLFSLPPLPPQPSPRARGGTPHFVTALAATNSHHIALLRITQQILNIIIAVLALCWTRRQQQHHRPSPLRPPSHPQKQADWRAGGLVGGRAVVAGGRNLVVCMWCTQVSPQSPTQSQG